MAVAAPAGISGKPLWQKLGLMEGQRLFVADPPEHLSQLLAGAPAGITRLARLAEFDIALLFVTSRNADGHRRREGVRDRRDVVGPEAAAPTRGRRQQVIRSSARTA